MSGPYFFIRNGIKTVPFTSSEDQLSSGEKNAVHASRGTQNANANDENNEARNALDDDIALAIVELCEEEDGSLVLRVSLEGSNIPSVSVCRFTADGSSFFVAWNALPHLHSFCRIAKVSANTSTCRDLAPSFDFVPIDADAIAESTIRIDTVLSSEPVRNACSAHGISTATIHHMIRQTRNAMIPPFRNDQTLTVHQFLAFSCLLEQRIADITGQCPISHNVCTTQQMIKTAQEPDPCLLPVQIDLDEDAKHTELLGLERKSKVQSLVSKDSIPKPAVKVRGEIDSPSSFVSTGRRSNARYDCAREESCLGEGKCEAKDAMIRASAELVVAKPLCSDDGDDSADTTSVSSSEKLSPGYRRTDPTSGEEEALITDDFPAAPTESTSTTQSSIDKPLTSSGTDVKASLNSTFSEKDDEGEDTKPFSSVVSICNHTSRDNDRPDESTSQPLSPNRNNNNTANKELFASQTGVYNTAEEKKTTKSPRGVPLVDVMSTAGRDNSSSSVKGSHCDDKTLCSRSSTRKAGGADTIEAPHDKHLSNRTFADRSRYEEAGAPSRNETENSVDTHAKCEAPDSTAQICAEATIHNVDIDAITPRSSSALGAETVRKPEGRPRTSRSTLLVTRTEIDNEKADAKKEQKETQSPKEQERAFTALSNDYRYGKASSLTMTQKTFSSGESSVASTRDKGELSSTQDVPLRNHPVDETTGTKPGIDTPVPKQDDDVISPALPSSDNPLYSLAVKQSTACKEEIQLVENDDHRECPHKLNKSLCSHANVDQEKLSRVLKLLPKLICPNGSGARISDYDYTTDYSAYFESRAPLRSPREGVFGD
mmetsp:Transcript_29186/g.63339  ORF Transcript_29186/g.63339 Transcript_29186/m.63339 type:complete len:828 (-) Transcript_29186:182-2665(-)|eukprot:CAMPEP_0178510198 /NCGR_PEP_ID=MMETSP0696-20121128/21701_1 /TAXON_ID=265572 /ORGANISM="Extubocellulus spinifer, Strain CCMP396" /LENGTH=827 /DNA_ID=CAMNT_0020139889 /DNA_START=158 /DNA_END=2641 /DNA_ORIENTATION=+